MPVLLRRYNFIEKVINTEKIMHLIKGDIREVLKLSMEFWKDFRNYKNMEFASFKKNLEV
jgi:hypothetical protein